MIKKPTLAIVSGGMDSTVLAYALSRGLPQMQVFHDKELTGIVSVNYGQRHSYELRCASNVARVLGVPWHCLELAGLRNHLSASSLTSDKMEVPEGHYAEENMRATVVPNRNMILLALSAGVAITQKAACLAYGAHAGDHAIYPDCRPEFVKSMSLALGFCDYSPPALIAPFLSKSKADLVALGLKLGVDFGTTWTCYKGVEPGDLPRACGRCGTCVERLEAFAAVGEEDPVTYEDREGWRELVATFQKGGTGNAHGI